MFSGPHADRLARVAGPAEAQPPGRLEGRREGAHVDAQLGRVGADPDDPLGPPGRRSSPSRSTSSRPAAGP